MTDRRDDMFRVKPRPPKGAGRGDGTQLSVASCDGDGQGGRPAQRQAWSGSRPRCQARSRLGRRATDGHEPGTARTPRGRQDPPGRVQASGIAVGGDSSALHRPRGYWSGWPTGQAYGTDTDAADVKAFEERSHSDRHQFRFIVAPEDGIELHDLRGFTRHLMQRMERDLGTRLEWIAVDHWDTDNPHTHVVLRGKDQTGEDLVIGREYISHGMRKRASELATAWLGPRTDLEIHASLRRDVDQERWTGLDRELHARAKDGCPHAGADPRGMGDLRRRALLIGRLQRLQSMGLARQLEPGAWELRPDAQNVLQRLGERRDIIRTMQRAFGAGAPRICHGERCLARPGRRSHRGQGSGRRAS